MTTLAYLITYDGPLIEKTPPNRVSTHPYIFHKSSHDPGFAFETFAEALDYGKHQINPRRIDLTAAGKREPKP